MGKILKSFSFWVFSITLVLSYWAGIYVKPTMILEKVALDVKVVEVGEDAGKLYYIYKGKSKFIEPVSSDASRLLNKTLVPNDYSQDDKEKNIEFIYEEKSESRLYSQLKLKRHFGFWSLIPAIVAVILCWGFKRSNCFFKCWYYFRSFSFTTI